MFYLKYYEEEDEGEERIMDNSYHQFYNHKWSKQRIATFRVEHNETKEEQFVEIDIKDTVIDLKQAVAKAFGVLPKQFEILYGQRDTFLPPSEDWMYVYQFIKDIDRYADPKEAVDIKFDAYDIKDFRERSITYSIIEDPSYCNMLWKYLKNADIADSIEAISVIERLPVLSDNLFDLKKYIERHKIEKHDHWYTVLKVKFDQPEELFMKMKLLDNLLYPEEFYNIDLRDSFIDNSGIDFLVDIVVQSWTILIHDQAHNKFALCASLISKALKLIQKVLADSDINDICSQENSLILMKSGLDFLEYMSSTANEYPEVAKLVSPQLEKDRIIQDDYDYWIVITSPNYQ
jgi:hypothetical protein